MSIGCSLVVVDEPGEETLGSCSSITPLEGMRACWLRDSASSTSQGDNNDAGLLFCFVAVVVEFMVVRKFTMLCIMLPYLYLLGMEFDGREGPAANKPVPVGAREVHVVRRWKRSGLKLSATLWPEKSLKK